MDIDAHEECASLRARSDARLGWARAPGSPNALIARAPEGALRADADGRYECADLALAAVSECAGRWLALSRVKLWWMAPAFGEGAAPLPPETQLVVGERAEGSGRYVVLLPLVHAGVRSSLRGGRGGDGACLLRMERVKVDADERSGGHDGDGACAPDERLVLLVACGTRPHALVEEAVAAAARALRTFEPRARKPQPAAARVFGWCTWDAFYHGVTPEGVDAGVASLAAAGAPPRAVIIDDGWQHTTPFPRNGKLAPGESEADPAPATRQRKKSLAAAWRDALSPDRAYDYLVRNSAAGGVLLRAFGAFAAMRSGRETLLEGYKASKGVASFTARLATVAAGGAFGGVGALAECIRGLKERHGVQLVYCWHAMLGYWGGVKPGSFGAAVREPRHTPGVLEVEPTMEWDPLTINGSGVPGGGRAGDAAMRAFYDALHGTIADAGADGVKVDVQSMAGALGGSALAARCHAALEASVSSNFGDGSRCINCMCHSTEALFAQATTSAVRASDDFYPNDAASHSTHIFQCAYNSVMLASFAWPDWDMFQSDKGCGALHAAARAVSGAPVYVSDAPGAHSAEVLARCVLPSGRVPCASQPALPCRDCLLRDTARDGATALKVYSLNGAASAPSAAEGGDDDSYRVGVVGAFNVQGSSWDVSTRRYVRDEGKLVTVCTTVCPGDVEGLVSVGGATHWALMARGGAGATIGDGGEAASGAGVALSIVDATRGVNVRLPPGAFAVVAIAPVLQVRPRAPASSSPPLRRAVAPPPRARSLPPARALTHARRAQLAGDARVALLGLGAMYNAGGAVVGARVSRDGRAVSARALGPGEFCAWCEQPPVEVLVRLSGGSPAGRRVDASHDAGSGLLTVPLALPEGARGDPSDEFVVDLVFG